MTTLEYVASGMGHTRIVSASIHNDPECLKDVNDLLKIANGRNNHKFSLLFNSFTEKNFGPIFKKYYKDSIYTVHADSGGLQIVTRGMQITPDLKDVIYNTQANYSDVAMCFDEIPIGITGERSKRMDVSDRYFDKDNLEFFARETGRNIRRQIEIFLDQKSTAKPYIIAQGNCYDTYRYWVEYLLDEIPQEHRKYIGGLAMGAAALGTGSLQDLERAAYATNLPIDTDNLHLHILGVGSVRRLLPYLALAKSGFYPKNIHISYDSTTHTGGLSLGTYFKDGALVINRDPNNPLYDVIYEDVDALYDMKSRGVTRDLFHEIINSSSTFYKDENEILDKERNIMYHVVKLSYVLSSICNFTYEANKMMDDYDYLIRWAEKCGSTKEIFAMSQFKNIDDFLNWKDCHQHSVKSNKVSSSISSSLEGFF